LHADFHAEVAIPGVDFWCDRDDAPVPRLSGPRLDRHDSGHSDLQTAGLELRDAGFELHLAHVGNDHDALAVARPDERALVEIALDDDASRWRRQRGITTDLFGAAQRRLRLLQRRRRQAARGSGRAQRGLGGVEALPGERALLEQVRRSIELELCVRQRRFGLFEPGTRDGDGGLGRIGLRVQLAPILNSNELSWRDAIADVHRDPLQRSRHLRNHGDAAPRRYAARNRERCRQIAGANRHDGDRWQFHGHDGGCLLERFGPTVVSARGSGCAEERDDEKQ
jgi:hypothetical protein